MNRIITKQELLNLSTEQISKLAKGRLVNIVLINGEIREVFIKNISAAANPPYLFTGFISAENESISLQLIDYVELI